MVEVGLGAATGNAKIIKDVTKKVVGSRISDTVVKRLGQGGEALGTIIPIIICRVIEYMITGK